VTGIFKMKVVTMGLVTLSVSTRAFRIQSHHLPSTRSCKAKLFQSLNVEEAAASEKESSNFENDGIFRGMAPFLKLGGISTGKKIIYGVLTADVDKQLTREEMRKQEREASEKMVNIGDQERARRDKIGTIILALSGIYALWAALVADDGGLYGHFIRFMVLPSFGLGYGYKLSAQTGL